jgi:DNA replication and repair protein RecF
MDEGDEVLYPNPGFPIYESQIEFLGGRAVPYAYRERDGRFRLDLGEIEAGIGPRTRILILNDLHNPTGAACSTEELEGLAEIAWLVPAMDRLWTEAAEGRRRFLDRMTMSFEPAHGDAVLAYEKAMRERNRLLKEEVRDPGWYAALEGRMAEAGARIVAHRAEALSRVATAQEGAATAFPAADLALAGSDGAEQPETEDALADAFAAGRPRDLAAGRTLVGPHRADLIARYSAKGVPAAQCSTGEQKALLLSLVLANARALAQDFGAPPLLLLDEVAAHLDAGRRAALYDEVCALGTQAWLTGTGRELFAGLEGRAQFLSVTEEGGDSLVEESA